MSRRLRRLTDLYHRYGARVGLDATEVASELVRLNAIIVIDRDHYRDADAPKMSAYDHDQMILKMLTDFKKRGAK